MFSGLPVAAGPAVGVGPPIQYGVVSITSAKTLFPNKVPVTRSRWVPIMGDTVEPRTPLYFRWPPGPSEAAGWGERQLSI